MSEDRKGHEETPAGRGGYGGGGRWPVSNRAVRDGLQDTVGWRAQAPCVLCADGDLFHVD